MTSSGASGHTRTTRSVHFSSLLHLLAQLVSIGSVHNILWMGFFDFQKKHECWFNESGSFFFKIEEIILVLSFCNLAFIFELCNSDI